MFEYLTPEELRYLASAPSRIEPDILQATKIRAYSTEIAYFKELGGSAQAGYLEAKGRIQRLIADTRSHTEFLLDLSGLSLTRLPPEVQLLERRAKYFYLDLSNNQFRSYYEVRCAITGQQSKQPIPFDAINFEGNPLRDLTPELIERGKFSTENIEKYWMKHWAKPYTLSSRIHDVVAEHRFSSAELIRLLELLQENLPQLIEDEVEPTTTDEAAPVVG